MILALEKPHLKGVSIFAYNLVTEEGFAAHKPNYNFDSERYQANDAIREANDELGEDIGKNSKAFSMMFNQFNWESTTGWEYWSEDFPLILRHALMTAKALKLPLHVHVDVMLNVIDAATTNGLTFDFDVATFEGEVHNEFEYTRKDIDAGAFYVLTNVQAL